MAQLGTKWVDDLVEALIRANVIPRTDPSGVASRIRASLKELVAGHNRAEGKVPPP